MDNTLISW